MKRFVWTLGAVVIGTAIAVAQPPGGPRGQGGPGGLGGGPGGRGGDFPPPPNPFVEVLDADGDRVISAEEIKNAPTSLLKLDTNKDGKLTDEETRPRPPGGGPGGTGGPEGRGRGAGDRAGGQRNAGRGQGAGPEGGGPGGRGPEGAGGPPGRGPEGGGPGPERMMVRAMEFDADNDGKLSRDELAKFLQEMAQRRPGGPGAPGGPGGREGDAGSGGAAERPRRPE